MRGKVEFRVCGFDRLGITPAYAGKREAWKIGGYRSKDHPRLCGEKFSFGVVEDILDRITPAYAGKSSGCCQTRFPYRDHPRLCGEKFRFVCLGIYMKGSPPPMRGKAKKPDSGQQKHRITPAYAGKSDSAGGMYQQQQDHPRLCGEKKNQ